MRLYKIKGNRLSPWRRDLWSKEHGAYFSSDSKWLIRWKWIKLENGQLWLDDLSNQRTLEFAGTDYGFSADGTVLATFDYEHTIRLYQLPSGKEVKSITCDETSERRFLEGRHPQNMLPVGIANGRWWDPKSRYSMVDVFSGRTLIPSYRWYYDCVVFSPDGRLIAVGGDEISLFETATGRSIGKFPNGHRGRVSSLAFSPDGKTIASGGAEGTILTWNWPVARKLTSVSPKPFETLWNDLRDADPARAYRAIFALQASPREVVPFLRDHLRPPGDAEVRRIHALIAALDSSAFHERERAMKELVILGQEVQPFLWTALEKANSAESEKRIKQLLSDRRLSELGPESLRALRAVQILADIRTSESQTLLSDLAKGVPGMVLTNEAQKAIQMNRDIKGQ